MLNKILKSIAFLIALGTKAISGVAQYTPELTLPHSIAADLPGKLAALNVADAVHKEANTELTTRRGLQANAVSDTRVFMTLAREHLKPRIGTRYSQAWDATGFMGSLQVSTSADLLLRAVQSMKGYLTAHPIVDGGPNLTAARAGVLYDNLSAAITAVTEQKDIADQAFNLRNDRATALEQGLRTLLGELHEVLDPMDSRWLAFGFLKPGQLQAPSRPGKVAATLIGSNAVALKWSKVARAEYYRVWKKVVGVDEDYVAVGSPGDLDFTLEGLPANSQIEIVISAVNNGGESQLSELVPVQTT